MGLELTLMSGLESLDLNLKPFPAARTIAVTYMLFFYFGKNHPACGGLQD